MTKALQAVIETKKIELAVGVIAGSYKYTLLKDGVALLPDVTAEKTVTFENLDAGVYTCSCVLLDNAGNDIGDPVVSEALTITADVATADAPASITITLV